MDFDEFSEGYLKLLQDLARVTVRCNKKELRKGMANSHVSLTAGEMALLADKIVGTINYLKTKLRDAGSGKFLPFPATSLLKIWHANHNVNAAKPQKPAKTGKPAQNFNLGLTTRKSIV